jgi:uncharacterized membrane protein YphA (DoxX/SURF4 family)
MTVVRIALAVVFAVAAVAKLVDSRATLGVRFVLPAFELGAAALLVLPGTTLAGAVLALALLAGFTGWVARDPSADCDCFGRLANMPGPLALLRNAVLLLAAGAVAFSALIG